jgi:hypothetical protein
VSMYSEKGNRLFRKVRKRISKGQHLASFSHRHQLQIQAWTDIFNLLSPTKRNINKV